ncbi:hypothetical protein NTH44_003361 [Vibrio metoecus]|nr:hypothetical protein [Vibrio cholerae]
MTANASENTLLTTIGTKPQFKNLLRKLTASEFEKIEKTLMHGLKEVRDERLETSRKEREKQLLIDEQLKKISEEHGIQISEIKAHLNKS